MLSVTYIAYPSHISREIGGGSVLPADKKRSGEVSVGFPFSVGGWGYFIDIIPVGSECH